MATTSLPSAGTPDKTVRVSQESLGPSKDPNGTHGDEERGVHQQAGISKVEAFNKTLYNSGTSGTSGRLLLYVLVVSLGLTMFAYAHDQGITYHFNPIAASAFSQHAQLGVVNTATTNLKAVPREACRHYLAPDILRRRANRTCN